METNSYITKELRIKKITLCENEDVYDATVEDVHNFVANNIIVKNSIEQDADVVMLIYRDDRYNKNSTNPNIAEILIAKHRNGPVGQVELYFNQEIASFRELDKTFEGSDSEGGYEQLTPPDLPVGSDSESEFLSPDEM